MVKENIMQQTEIGWIPEDWEVKTVEESFEICNNLRLPISDNIRKRMQGKYPYYGPTRIQDYINQYRVEGEYSLIGEDGDHFLKWADVPMTQLTFGQFNVNNHAHLVKGKSDITITKWFYFYFKHRDITNYLTRQGANRYKLSKSTLNTLPFALPPLPEQQAIAEALSDADAWIGSLEDLIAKKRLIKQGAMQELLTPKEGWEVKTLGEIGKCIRGVSYSGESDLYDVETESSIRLLRSNNIFHSKVLLENVQNVNYLKVREHQIIKEEDILICMANGSKDLVGKAGFCGGKVAKGCYTFGAFMGIFRITEDCSRYFVYQNFLTKNYRNYIDLLLSGSSINNLKPSSIESIEIHFPSFFEQTRIATVLSDMDTEIEKLEQKLNKARQIKQGMMQELLTGRVRLV